MKIFLLFLILSNEVFFKRVRKIRYKNTHHRRNLFHIDGELFDLITIILLISIVFPEFKKTHKERLLNRSTRKLMKYNKSPKSKIWFKNNKLNEKQIKRFLRLSIRNSSHKMKRILTQIRKKLFPIKKTRKNFKHLIGRKLLKSQNKRNFNRILKLYLKRILKFDSEDTNFILRRNFKKIYKKYLKYNTLII